MTPQELSQATGLAEQRGDEWYGLCPCHDDNSPSLAITERSGITLWTCRAGCEQETVTKAIMDHGWLNGSAAGRVPGAPGRHQSAQGPGTYAQAAPGAAPGAGSPQAPPPWERPIEAEYLYQDEPGDHHGKVIRFGDGLDPRFMQQHWTGEKWKWGAPERSVIYNLPEVIQGASKNRWLFICEGKADCNSLTAHKLISTTNPAGAKSWKPEHADQIPEGSRVAVLWDRDEPGEKRRDAVLQSLYEKVAVLKRIDLPDLPNKKGADITDWLAAGHTPEQLRTLVMSTDEWKPSAAGEVGSAGAVGGTHGTIQDEDLPPGLSEDALASQFTELHGGKLRFTAAWGKWNQWDGERWKEDNTLAAFDLARKICKAAVNDPDLKQAQVNRIASSKTVAGVISLARTDRRHAATVDQWDANHFHLNTPGETINLENGDSWTNTQEDYCTKITSVKSGGKSPLWLSVLDYATGGDGDLIAYLQRMAGYCLTGSIKEEALFFIHGPALAGKSKFIGALAGVLGDYATTASMETFTETRGDRHPTDLAHLRGSRLVTATETEEGRYWNESRIKALTGGDRIAARFMRQDFFTFIPTFKILIAGNYKPRLRNADAAMRRRLQIIPFERVVPPEMRDNDLAEKLEAEYPGILEWCIQGVFEWKRVGLAPPEAVTGATDEYFESEDAVSRWIGDCCTISSQSTKGIMEFYESWREWCLVNGEHDPGKNWLGEALVSRGFPRVRGTGGKRSHTGLYVKPDEK